jgi:hypothetical protein
MAPESCRMIDGRASYESQSATASRIGSSPRRVIPVYRPYRAPSTVRKGPQLARRFIAGINRASTITVFPSASIHACLRSLKPNDFTACKAEINTPRPHRCEALLYPVRRDGGEQDIPPATLLNVDMPVFRRADVRHRL